MGARLLVAFLLTAWLAPAAHAAPAPRILYAADWPGTTEIFAADPSGHAPIGQVTSGRPDAPCPGFPSACGYANPLPSPDGRRLLYTAAGFPSYDVNGADSWLAAAGGSGARPLGPIRLPSWSPDSNRLAYVGPGGIHVVRADGSGDHIVDRRTAAPVWSPDGTALAFATGSALIVLRNDHELRAPVPASGDVSWSRDGRWIAFTSPRSAFRWIKVAEVTPGSLRVRTIGAGSTASWAPNRATLAYFALDGLRAADPRSGRSSLLVRYRLDTGQPWRPTPPFAWSPDGRRIAYVAFGTELVDVATRRTALLTLDAASSLAWSPDGRSLAYLLTTLTSNENSGSFGDLRVVTLNGRVRTVAATDRAWGGQITSFAWTRPAAAVRYRAPAPVDGAFAGGTVQWLAADAGRVTWSACKQFWTWTADLSDPRRVDPEGGSTCEAPFSRGEDYGFATAGDRLVWGEKGAGLGFQWGVGQRSLTGSSTPVTLGTGFGTLGSTPSIGMGTFGGSGSLLVLSSWQLAFGNGTHWVKSETISRVEPDGSLTPISSTPGPYIVMDVEGGLIVAGGDNETVVLDSDGRQLAAVPVSAVAAQLDGAHLVVLVHGALLDYAYPSGLLLHTWPLPDVPVGRPCSVYGDPTCPVNARLILHDAANGLAAYVLDGSIHLLRLADGMDTLVGPGTAADFFDGGLAYADGARVHVVPL